MRGFEPLTSCMRMRKEEFRELPMQIHFPDFTVKIGVNTIEKMEVIGGLKIINGHFLDTFMGQR